MRFLLFLALLLPLPAAAQLIAPLTLPDGRIACTQGKTGAGRVTDWKAVPDPSAPGGWALSETAGDATDLRFALCISEQTDALEGSVRLYRMMRGRRAQIAAKDVEVASDQWHALRVILKGNTFEVSLDDTPLFKATDASLPQPGTVGVWSQADSIILFGSLLVAPPP